jgi:hypothetical protein
VGLRIGVSIRKRRRSLEENEREAIGTVMAAILTPLSLIIGFSFSMAIFRYDQRKNLEAAEADAIDTEYVRADSLPTANAASVCSLLRNYLDQCVLLYKTHDDRQLQEIDAATGHMQHARSLASLFVNFFAPIKPLEGFNAFADVIVGMLRGAIVPNDCDHRISTQFVIFGTDLDINSLVRFATLPLDEIYRQFHLIIVQLGALSGCRAVSNRLASHRQSPPKNRSAELVMPTF